MSKQLRKRGPDGFWRRVRIRAGNAFARARDRCKQRCCGSSDSRVYVAERCDTVTPGAEYPPADPVFQPPKIRWAVPYLCGNGCEVVGSQLIVYHGYCYRVVLGGFPTECEPGRVGPARVQRDDPLAADAVEVPGSEVVCQPLPANCLTASCRVPPPPPECCNDGWTCGDAAANFPNMAGCFGCDCNCGGDFELTWSGFYTGSEYSPTVPCTGTDPCTSLFCMRNLCYSVQLSWNVTIRFTCNPDTHLWRAEFTFHEYRQSSQFIPNTCGCAADQPAPISYLGPMVVNTVLDPTFTMPPCGMPPYLLPVIAETVIPGPDPSLCARCGIPDACAGQGAWMFYGLDVFSPSCEWSRTLGDNQQCGTFGNVRGEVHASCSGGTLEQTGQYGEVGCPGSTFGGVRAEGRLGMQWSYRSLNPCDRDRVRMNDAFERTPTRRAFL